MYSYINLKCVGGGQYVYNSAEIHFISNMNISLSMKIVISLMKIAWNYYLINNLTKLYRHI